MLQLFFDSSGIVHTEFIPEGVTVNKHRYKEILRRLRNSIRRKHLELWRRKNWLLLHNAPAHYSALVQKELAKRQVTVLSHPPYSPDLTTCDFFLFPRLKEKIHGHRFQLAKEIITATREAAEDLPANIFQRFPAAIPTLADLHSGQRQLF
jgi:histone-lysine N-methyltransferase SETMAR